MVTNNCCDYSPTQYAVQVGGANGTLSSISVGASDSALQGSTGANPSFTTTPRIVGLGIGAASTGSGLTFDGSNTMSSYSIGTWTPSIQFGGASVGITYSTQTGYYTKIGNVVYVSMNVVLTSKGSSTGSMTIVGLPFTPTISAPRGQIQANNITFVGNALVIEFNTNNSARIIVEIISSGSNQLASSGVANNSSFIATGFYYST